MAKAEPEGMVGPPLKNFRVKMVCFPVYPSRRHLFVIDCLLRVRSPDQKIGFVVLEMLDIDDFDPLLQGFCEKTDQTTFVLKLVSKTANVNRRRYRGSLDDGFEYYTTTS